MDDIHPIELPAAGAAERGPSPEDPSDVPRRGWWGILLGVYNGIFEDRILMNAAAVAFYALLALFPGIAAIVSIYGLFANPSAIAGHLSIASGIVPGGGMTIIQEQLHRLASKGSGTLSIGFVVSLVISLWSANGGIKGLFDALNVVFGEQEKRSFLKLNAVSLLFTLAMIGFLIVAIVCIVAVPVALHYLPDFVGRVIDIARWPLIAVLAMVALAFIYCFGPSRGEPRWQSISWGGIAAALLWLGFSWLFSYYAANFGNFNRTYGSLGAVVGFMTWIWLSVAVILLGGKLNAEIEDQTLRDSGDRPANS
jgi:membrane protein